MVEWRVKVFGPLGLFHRDESVTSFGTVRSAKLLALLALSSHGRLRREDLADLLWPEDFYDATRLRLRQEIHRLKSALREHSELLSTSTQEVAIDRSDLKTDVELMQQALLRPELQLSVFKVLSESVFEPFLPGWDEPAFIAERRTAESARANFIAAVAERLIDGGQAEEAQRIAKRLIPDNPLHEPLRFAAMRASASLGSLSGAVAEYQQYRRALKEAKNADPSDVAEERMQAILRPAETLQDSRSFGGRIPAPIDRLFGRESEMDRVIDLLTPSAPKRLLTLVGPGGIGKTRLAIEVGQRLSGSYSDRVGFVSLADVLSPDEAVRTIAGQIGYPVPAGVFELDYLSRALDGESTLLTLDNLEKLQPGISQIIQDLLQACPRLKILATSLTPLRLDSEHSLPLTALDPLAEGAEMLQNLLRASRPVSSTVPGIEDSIRQLSIALDGYPLAIRLAGGRLRTLSPAALLSQIQSRASVLASARLDLPDRQRSMEAALEWSLQALSATDRETLELLAGFPGGVSYELAESVIDSPDLLDMLERLVESALLSLTDHGEEVRFRLLGPVRDYLMGQLSPASAQESRIRAARAILESTCARVPKPFGPVTSTQLRWFDQEFDNLQGAYELFRTADPAAAVEIVARTWNLEGFRGRQLSILPRIDEVIRMTHDPIQLRHLRLAKAELLASLPRDEEASAALSEVTIDMVNDADASATAMVVRAGIIFRLGHRQFEQLLPEVEDLFRQGGSDFQRARLDYLIGTFHYFRREIEQSIPYLDRAFKVLVGVGDLSLGGRCGFMLSSALSENGLERAAAEAMAQSSTLALATGDPLRIAYLRENEGRYALKSGRADEAERAFRESLALWSRVDSAFQMADQMHSLNQALRAQGRFDEAAEMLKQSAELWLKDKNAGGLTQGLTSIAEIHRIRDNEDLAREIMSFAMAFQAAHHVTLVPAEHAFQSRLVADLVPVPPYLGPLELTDAFRWSKSL